MGRYIKNKELKSGSYSIRLPMGSNSIGPDVPVTGLIRYNTDRRRPELYSRNKWRPMGTGGDIEYPIKDTFYGDGQTNVFGPMLYPYPTGNEIFVMVFIHNVFQNPGIAYIVDGYEIQFTSPPPNGHAIVILHGVIIGDATEQIPSWYSYPDASPQPSANVNFWSLTNTAPYPTREGSYLSFEIGLTSAGKQANLAFPQSLYLEVTANVGNIVFADFGNLTSMNGNVVGYSITSGALQANINYPDFTTVQSYFLDVLSDAVDEPFEEYDVSLYVDSARTNRVDMYTIQVLDTSVPVARASTTTTTTTTTTSTTTTTTTAGPLNYAVLLDPSDSYTSTPNKKYNYAALVGQIMALSITNGPPNATWTISNGTTGANVSYTGSGTGTLNGSGGASTGSMTYTAAGVYQIDYTFTGFAGNITRYYNPSSSFVRLEITVT